MEIQVLAKEIYGHIKFYPKCEKARTFASIAVTTTLTEKTLREIVRLGYTVTVDTPQIQIQGVLK